MSKQIEKDILELIKKWSSVKSVFPNGWSEIKQLSNAPISYKTYTSGNIDYINIEINSNDVEYKINTRYGSVVIEKPLSASVTAKKALEELKTIYEEETSIKSQVEGKASIRKEISDKRTQIKQLSRDIAKLETRLQGSSPVLQGGE